MTWKEIIAEIDAVEYISQYIELREKANTVEWWGNCCFHNEKTASFSVNPIKKTWYCFGCGFGGNIYDFIKRYKNVGFSEAAQIVGQYLGIELSEKVPKLEIIKVLERYNIPKKTVSEKTIITLGTDYMERFQSSRIIPWEKEHISFGSIDSYGIKYDAYSNVACIPIHNNIGELINVKGRRLNTDWKERGQSKYLHYFNLPSKIDYFFGYYRNKDRIKELGEVVLVEAEKSCLQLDGYGVSNAIAIGTCFLTEWQLKTLLSMRVRIVLALDKDKNPRDMEYFKKLDRYCELEVIGDTAELLGTKDSPTDKGNETWEKLYAGRKKF